MTTQEPPQSSSSAADLPDLANIPRATLLPPPQKTDRAILESDTQSKRGDEYLLAGDVEINFRDHKLRADTITYNEDTGDAIVQGHVHLTGGENDESIEASHGTYNLRTNTGRFYDVHGSVGLHTMANPDPKAPPPNPFLFNGRVVVVTGRNHYDVYDGDVTACLLPHPDWLLSSHHIAMNDDKTRAAASTFRLLNIPILFLPYVTHPVDADQRQSGLLIPVLSHSSTKGWVFGEEVYLTLGRSADITAGFEYLTLRGFSESGTARYKGRDENFFTGRFSALQDRGYYSNGVYLNQGGEDITAAFRYDFTNKTRAVADAEYLSSYIYREAFDNNFNQAVSSDITSVAYLTHQTNGYDFSGRVDRYEGLKQVPIGTNPGAEVKIFHAPSLDFTALDHPIAGTPFLWDVSTSAAELKRVQPNFSTNGMTTRFDIRPEISLPLSGSGWHTLSSFAVRDTFYNRSRQAPYTATAGPIELDSSINRFSVETNIDIRPPAIERTFEVPARYQKFLGTEVRHTIEPELDYKNTSGITNFLSVLRFDDVDLDSDTNELEYGVTQHLYFHPHPAPRLVPKPGCPATPQLHEDLPEEPQATSSETAMDANGIPTVSSVPPTRHVHKDPCTVKKDPNQQEFFSWKLAQRHFFDPTFGGAVLETRRNIFDTTLSLSGIAFLTEPRNISPLISRMRFRTSGHTDIGWDFDLDITAQKFTSSNLYFDAHEGQLFGGFSFARLNAPGRFSTERINSTNGAVTLITSPTSNFSQMRVLLGFGAPTKPGFSAAASAGLDLGSSGGQNSTPIQPNPFLQYATLQASYNWNCCGLSVEYRKYELGSVRNESTERFSFTLINIGSAGNLRRQERLF